MKIINPPESIPSVHCRIYVSGLWKWRLFTSQVVVCIFPVIKVWFIWTYFSVCFGNSSSPKIWRELIKVYSKIIDHNRSFLWCDTIALRQVHSLVLIWTYRKLIPFFKHHINIKINSSAIEYDRILKNVIIFFYFYRICGHYLHITEPPFALTFFLWVDVMLYLLKTSVTDSNNAIGWIPKMSSPQLFF